MIFHLMIVDDEAPVRKGISQFINWEAINCTIEDTASDGLEAIEKLLKLPVDIVITDIRMPEADGLYLAKYIYEHNPDIKVIILTGYADFSYAQSAIQFNVSDFLLKPISKEQVITAVQNAQKKIVSARQQKHMEQSNMAFLKDQLLQELTDHPGDEGLALRLTEYGVRLTGYYVLAFQLMDPEGEIASLKELVSARPFEGCYRYTNVILSIYHRPEQNEAPEGFMKLCREIQEMGRSMYGMGISVGISGFHSSPGEYAKAVSEAIHALAQNFYSADTIAKHEDYVSSRPGEMENSRRGPEEEVLTAMEALALNDLETAIISRDFEAATSVVKSIFIRMKSRFAKSADVKNMCVMIYYAGFRALVKKGLVVPEGELLKRIEGSGDIFVLEEIIMEFLEYVKVSLMGSEGLSRIVRQAMAYIDSHLASPLSLDDIAGEIPINPSYLSRVFKKETGQALTEYINLARIQRAKELLLDGTSLNYEVAEQAGFHDPAYFSAIFKKYTGMSPKEFKNQAFKR